MKTIKTLVAAATMLLAAAMPAQAQKVNLGIEAGYTYNSLLVSGDYDTEGLSGFAVGAVVDVALPQSWTLQTGLSYVRKGGSVSGEAISGTKITQLHDMNLNYLRVPVMVGRKVSLGAGFSITPRVGWYFAEGISGSGNVTGDSDYTGSWVAMRVESFKDFTSRQGENEILAYKGCNRFDTGIAIGVNFDYRHFGIKVGYDFGVTRVTSYGKGHNSSLSVGLVYRLW